MGIYSLTVLKIHFPYAAPLHGMALTVCAGRLLEDDFIGGGDSSQSIQCGVVALITLLIGLVFSARRDVGLAASVFCVAVRMACLVRRPNSDGES